MMKRIVMLIVLTIGWLTLIAQVQLINGVVVGEIDNEPIIGAPIVVKGTSIATLTDVNGKFFLHAEKGTLLVITYTGMKPQEIEAESDMRIIMKYNYQTLNDIVIVPYGVAAKSSYTGSIATLNSEDIDLRPVSNFASVIEGKVAGVQMSSTNGQPGSTPNIRIRGFGSINASNYPLIVIDGIVYNGVLSNINPNDIESISLLKDAASTSLYGSSAGNGVVLITTKSAKTNGTNLDLSISQGFSTRAIPEYEKVDVWQYYPLQWEMMKNQYISANGETPNNAARLASNNIYNTLYYNPFEGVANNAIVGTDGKLNSRATQLLWGDDLDWQDEMERIGTRSEYNLSYSTKTDKSNTYASIGYLKDNSYVIKSDFERYSGRINYNIHPVKWFKTGLNITANQSKSNMSNAADNSGSYSNPFYFIRTVAPIYPIHQHNSKTGDYILDGAGNPIYDYDRSVGVNSGRHIVAETKWNNRKYTREASNISPFLELYLYNGLKAEFRVSRDESNYKLKRYDNKLVGDGAKSGRLGLTDSRVTSYTFNQILTYNTNFNLHRLDFLFGHENFAYKYRYSYLMKQDQILDGIMELHNFTTVGSLNSLTDNYTKEGYLSRVNYDYNDRYYLSLSYRRDGSSRFSKDSRWGNFWSLGGSWRMDKENFMENYEWINNLKLRASTGQVGVDDMLDLSGNSDYYPYQSLYSMDYNNALEAGIVFDSFGNKKLKWESQTITDLALEFKVLDRISATIEYFNKESKDLLFKVPLSLSTGTDYIWKNIGAMRNNGLEIAVDVDIFKNKDWTVNAGLNATFLRNKITKMPEEQTEILNGTKKWKVGQSVYQFWLKDYRGVDPDDGSVLYAFDRKNQQWNTNDCRIINGDSLTTNQSKAEYHYAGSSISDVYGGFNLKVKYKSFDLSMVFSYAIGGKTYNVTYQNLMNGSSYGGAMHKDILKRWQAQGDITNVPRLDGDKSVDFDAISDRWLVDTDFLHLKSFVLSYTLPMFLVSKADMKSARISFSAENLFVFNKMKGMDSQQSYLGLVDNSYIPSRSFAFGLNVSF